MLVKIPSHPNEWVERLVLGFSGRDRVLMAKVSRSVHMLRLDSETFLDIRRWILTSWRCPVGIRRTDVAALASGSPQDKFELRGVLNLIDKYKAESDVPAPGIDGETATHLVP